MTKSEAMRIVAMLQGAWPHRQMPDATAEIYALALADLEFEAAKRVVLRLGQTSRFMPSVAEIHEVIAEDRCDLPLPEEAWGEVRRAISRIGSYYRPVFACPEIDQAVQALGWSALCHSDNPASDRARFIDAYRSLRERRLEQVATGRYMPPERALPGATEGAGRGHGAMVLVPSSRARASAPALMPHVEGDE